MVSFIVKTISKFILKLHCRNLYSHRMSIVRFRYCYSLFCVLNVENEFIECAKLHSYLYHVTHCPPPFHHCKFSRNCLWSSSDFSRRNDSRNPIRPSFVVHSQCFVDFVEVFVVLGMFEFLPLEPGGSNGVSSCYVTRSTKKKLLYTRVKLW